MQLTVGGLSKIPAGNGPSRKKICEEIYNSFINVAKHQPFNYCENVTIKKTIIIQEFLALRVMIPSQYLHVQYLIISSLVTHFVVILYNFPL